MNCEKQLWFHVGEQTTPEVLSSVFNSSYSTLFVDTGAQALIEKVQLPQRMELSIVVRNLDDLARWERNESLTQKTTSVVSADPAVAAQIRGKTKYKSGVFVSVADRRTLEACVEVSQNADLLLVDFKDPTNIPLELILAVTQPLNTMVFKRVSSAEDGEVSLMTMEKGSDGILLRSDDVREIGVLGDAFERARAGHFALQPATVTRITHSGMGDRVCVDTTSELFEDEGMLIGSTSSGGLMICSETHFLPYMNLRPFRVNAGALHSYIWGPNNFVPYLSDLKAGDKVYAVNGKGQARIVTIGRLKIERRPMLNIHAEVGGQLVNTFIQDDWHVRVFGSQAEIRPSSEVRIGDKLLGFADRPGRHVGIKINETIKEA
jgi:3-amino-4-hydroxybenzoic acid synthase